MAGNKPLQLRRKTFICTAKKMHYEAETKASLNYLIRRQKHNAWKLGTTTDPQVPVCGDGGATDGTMRNARRIEAVIAEQIRIADNLEVLVYRECLSRTGPGSRAGYTSLRGRNIAQSTACTQGNFVKLGSRIVSYAGRPSLSSRKMQVRRWHRYTGMCALAM